MHSTHSPDRKIEDIQALRGIAIIFVLIQHLNFPHLLLPKFYHKVESPFYIGVEMFFLISGYVVTLALFKDHFRGGRFLIKRFFRLTPVLILFLGFSYCVILVMRSIMPHDIARFSYFAPADTTFIHQGLSILGGFFVFIDSPASFQNGAIWSLSVEDQFYAALTVICVAALVLKRIVRIPAQWWVGAVSALILITIMWMRIRHFRGKPATVVWPKTLDYLFGYRFDFLALGVLLGMFDRSFPGKIRDYFKERGPFLVGFLIMLPLVVTALSESPMGSNRRLRDGFAMPVILASFALLVLLAGNSCAFPASRGRIYKGLVWTGNRSYTIYVFHFPVLAIVWMLSHKLYPAVPPYVMKYALIQAVAMIPILLLVVEPVYRWVEMPLTRYGKRLVDGRSHTPSASSDPVTTVPSEPTPIRVAA